MVRLTTENWIISVSQLTDCFPQPDWPTSVLVSIQAYVHSRLSLFTMPFLIHYRPLLELLLFSLREVLLQTSTPTQSLVMWNPLTPPRPGKSSIVQFCLCHGYCVHDCNEMCSVNHLGRKVGSGSQSHGTLHHVTEDMRQLTHHIASTIRNGCWWSASFSPFYLSRTPACRMALSIFRVILTS